MLSTWRRLLARLSPAAPSIPEPLWHLTLRNYPFLAALAPLEQTQLQLLSSRFLATKEFSGANGLVVTDEMAVAIAAQACLPVLHLGLKFYDDFKGIVVHPGAMLARREIRDVAGVVHHYSEALVGEAMERGPVTLSWQEVAASRASAAQGQNVVIHEFVHKLDMRDGGANGCPPLPSRAARAAWHTQMQAAYEGFRRQVVMAERFGSEPPWLDTYGAQSPVEFFAVAAEAYFVNRARFELDFPTVTTLFDAFFKQKSPASV